MTKTSQYCVTALLGLLFFCYVTEHIVAQEVVSGPVEIVLSFDTTGSMSGVIAVVRTKVEELISRLQSDIPGIRIAVFAHGDYGDIYVTKHIDFTQDVEALKTFVRDVKNTGGGDSPEAYEKVLFEVGKKLSWSQGSRRALVMIGDQEPHKVNYRSNRQKINWRTESRHLRDMGVKIYAIQALQASEANYFYRDMANITDGFHLRLQSFNDIFVFLMAISYRAFGLEYLKLYEEEIHYRHELANISMSRDLTRLFAALKRSQEFSEHKTTITPTRRTKSTVAMETTTAPTIAVKDTKIKVNSLHVRSDISYRFATSTVTSQLANAAHVPQEVTFKVRLPDPAFISNFSMTIDGKSYHAEVKEKEQAKKEYIKAKAEGKTAGHVEQTERKVNEFKVSVNVAAQNKIHFNLTYQELLERHLGVYEHKIYVDPGQIVPDLRIDIFIQESRDLSYLQVPPLQSQFSNVISLDQENSLAKITRSSPSSAHIAYQPTVSEQEQASESGLQGQFVVQYDVTRSPGGGEIQVVDGYFVHYFAPEGLPPRDKNVVFVLDTSGSMYGEKIAQLKGAMLKILNDLRPGDYFNIVSFSSFLRFWNKQSMMKATEENIEKGKEFVRNFLAVGGTNINDAALRGMKFLQNHRVDKTPSMVIFLTDGVPTDSETNKEKILENIKTQNNNSFSIFSLGFGEGVDFPFLRKMALQNKGFSRKIYADADASLQLTGFYDEVGTPLLSDVTFRYIGDNVNVTSITETSFTNYFKGSEIIVCGFMDNEIPVGNLVSEITGNSATGYLQLDTELNLVDGTTAPPFVASGEVTKFTERLWAYLTIKNLLDKELRSNDKDEKERLKKKALELSLKYHFVTPVTSLLVVKPDDDDTAIDKHVTTRAPPTEKPRTLDDFGLEIKGDEHDEVGAEAASYGFDRSSHIIAPKRRGGGGGGRGGGGGGDPHFLIPVFGLSKPVCFDITGKRGQILQLLHDPINALTVNARIVAKSDNTTKTYFGEIALVGQGSVIVISPRHLTVNGRTYKWRVHVKRHHKIKVDDIVIDRYEQDNVTVNYRGINVKFVIVRRLVRKSHPHKVDYLGLFVSSKAGLSKQTQGLVGQFQHATVEEDPPFLRFPDARTPLRMHVEEKPNMARRSWEECYFADNEGQGLIKGRPKDYEVPELLYARSSKDF